MSPKNVSRRWRFGVTVLIALSVAFAVGAASPSTGTSSSVVPGQTTGLLPKNKNILESTIEVNLTHHSATLPLHKGRFHGERVWYDITEASDEGAARDLNVNFAPKLANVGIGCPVCVQDVSLTTPRSNKFGEAVAHFQGSPDFSPRRVLKAGPNAFPPAVAKPGGVASRRYSPFIKLRGSETVYNAPIVATGSVALRERVAWLRGRTSGTQMASASSSNAAGGRWCAGASVAMS